jgi:hypothetical protein
VLPEMPTKHVVAMLLASKPAQATTALLAMTPNRIRTLLGELPAANLGRMVHAAGARDKATLVATLSPSQLRDALSDLSAMHLVQILTDLPPELGWAVLRDVPARAAAGLIVELPAERQRRLEDLLPPDKSAELTSALYERRVTEAIVRSVERTTRLDDRTGDLRAELFGRVVQIAVRYVAGVTLTGPDVAAAASNAKWREIAGLLVLTNAESAETARTQVSEFCRAGTPIEVVTWLDTRDDGAFKRSLVRLAG